MNNYAKVALLLSGLSAVCSLGLSVPPVRPPSPTSIQRAWDSEQWTGNDQPYRAIRAEVDRLAASAGLTDITIGEYRRDYEQAKEDPNAVFRYAYAFYRRQRQINPLNPVMLNDTTFEAAPSPHAYNYDRIRFLANANSLPNIQFVPVGRRLLQRAPGDSDVEDSLIDCLMPWKSAAAKEEALGYANDLVRQLPDKQDAYSQLAYVYFSCWLAHHNQPDARSAIAAYRKCILLLPSDNPRRAFLEKRIKDIQDHTPQ